MSSKLEFRCVRLYLRHDFCNTDLYWKYMRIDLDQGSVSMTASLWIIKGLWVINTIVAMNFRGHDAKQCPSCWQDRQRHNYCIPSQTYLLSRQPFKSRHSLLHLGNQTLRSVNQLALHSTARNHETRPQLSTGSFCASCCHCCFP